MDETIKLLREQTILCAKMPALFDELIEVMKNNSPDVQEPIHKIEMVMHELSLNEKKAEEFLKSVNAPSFSVYLESQKKNLKRDMAEKLLKKAVESHLRLKNQVAMLKVLLQSGKNFVEFNLNILARTSASDTYSGNAQRESRRERRMFEANV